MEFYAHVDKYGNTQTLEAHLEGTAQLAASFAVDELKSAAFYLGRIHDIGKCRPNFQRRLFDNTIRCEHACCAASEIMKNKGPASYLLAYCAAGHHSGLQNGGAINDSPDDGTLHAALNKDASDYLPAGERFRQNMPDMKPLIGMLTDGLAPNDNAECVERAAFFTRYLFSCLTDADFLDTERFCSPKADRSISGDFAKALEKVDNKLAEFKCDTAVRTARKSLQEQAFSACENGGIHIMNMPTGSGKTLCSIKLALQKAVSGGKKRIIYVIPYTSIIEQTAEIFTELFGDVLPVVQHHSNYCPDEDESSDITEDKLKMICENWDAPLIVTTNVQFFQSFYHRKSSKLRKLHNIADSVIVFDEVHMMPVPFLQPCLRAVGYAVKYLGSEAFFLSATMPDFTELLNRYANGCEYDELIKDKTDFKMFRNSQIRFMGQVSQEKLAQLSDENVSMLIIVNSRKTALELYELCKGTDRKVFCLSTYITANDRSELIKEIRKLISIDDPVPVTVISTSLIEAGVDLDFETVYREISGLDSILQSAGRCNREGKRSGCFTNVFIGEDGMPSKGNIAKRANISNELLKSGQEVTDPAVITEYYRRLYQDMKQEIEGNTISAGVTAVDSIPFRDYSDRIDKMIDDDSIGIVIPCEENKELLDKLDSGDRKVFRKLQKYTASVHCTGNNSEFNTLRERGLINDFGTGIYRLTVPEMYTREKGLDPNYEFQSVL